MKDPDTLKTDLCLNFKDDGTVDLDLSSGEVQTINGKNNLIQALKLKLLMDRGELSGLGHSRHGTLIRDLLGEPLNRANLELLRRYVRKAILEDPRVKEINELVVQPKPDEPGAVGVAVIVTAIDGSIAEFDMTVNEL